MIRLRKNKIRRFYYIAAPHGAVIHRSESRIEGSFTFCGRTMRLGWKWYLGLRGTPRNRSICAQCEGG